MINLPLDICRCTGEGCAIAEACKRYTDRPTQPVPISSFDCNDVESRFIPNDEEIN